MGVDFSSLYFISIVSSALASAWAADDGKVIGMEMGGEFGGEKENRTNIQKMGVRMSHTT